MKAKKKAKEESKRRKQEKKAREEGKRRRQN